MAKEGRRSAKATPSITQHGQHRTGNAATERTAGTKRVFGKASRKTKTTQRPLGRSSRRMALVVPAGDVSAGKGGGGEIKGHMRGTTVYSALQEERAHARQDNGACDHHNRGLFAQGRSTRLLAVPVSRPADEQPRQPTSLATKRKIGACGEKQRPTVSEDSASPFIVFLFLSPPEFPLSRMTETRPSTAITLARKGSSVRLASTHKTTLRSGHRVWRVPACKHTLSIWKS